MSREIKFRAWCEEKKEMLQLQKMSFKTGKCMPYGWNLAYEFTDIMQYTGLKDKMEKDIYEGDIVEFHTNIITKTKAKVEFDCYGFMLSEIHDINCCYLGDIDIDDDLGIQVIGNIYEDKELLEG
ncbi:MAG: YopX family protein [Clostridium sp.]